VDAIRLQDSEDGDDCFWTFRDSEGDAITLTATGGPQQASEPVGDFVQLAIGHNTPVHDYCGCVGTALGLDSYRILQKVIHFAANWRA
jgi:hypothetical protein